MINVVITGAEHPTGLGTARALSGLGCKITGLYRRDKTFCCASKYWNQLISFDEYDNFVDLLVSFGKKQHVKSVLFPVQDNVVKLVSDNRDLLETYYYFHLPDKEIVDLFLDKAAFYEWALQHGFQVPTSFVCQSQEQLDNILNKIQFPVIIKPFTKTDEWEKVSPLYKVYLLNSRGDIQKIKFDYFSATKKILVQQWVSGGDESVYFCLMYYDGHGREIAYYTGRKFFQWPPYCGSTAAAIGEDNEEVHRVARKMFGMVNYCGLGSVEMKRNDADGKYYLIEPTVGRNDLQSNVAVAGGVNLSQMAVCELLGLERVPFRKKRGVWIHEEGLIDSLRYYRKQGNLLYGDIWRLVSIHSMFVHFDRRDIMPFMSLLSARIKDKMHKLLHR